MKLQNTPSSMSSVIRSALAASLAIAANLVSHAAAAADAERPLQVASLDKQWNDAAPSPRPRQDLGVEDAARLKVEGKYSGFSLNFTPVLIAPHNDERLGGGADPELKYTLDRGSVRLSAGLRVGAYYARNLFGVTAMPTLRLLVPVGPVEPYVSFGMGYGWLPKIEHSGIATMSRLGVVFRFSENFGLGIEGTIQRIERSAFAFPSFGSAMSLNF